MHFLAPCGANKSIFCPSVEKNCVQREKKIYFAHVIVARAKKKFFFPSCTIYLLLLNTGKVCMAKEVII